MSKWDFTDKTPHSEADNPLSKRNVILTDKGYVRRQIKTTDGNERVLDEVLVAAHPGGDGNYANSTFGGPSDISVIYTDDNMEAGNPYNVYVSFNTPIAFNNGASANNLTLSVANTAAGGGPLTATCTAGIANTIINANNTLVFSFTPAVAGTYKVEAQDLSTTGMPLYNPDLDINFSEASLTITGEVSNALAEFVVA